MLMLHEYRRRADRLADHLPWAALVAPGIVLNKDGSFQRSFAFTGPDLESATEAELVVTCARANNALKRLGSGWAMFFEAERIEALGYPQGDFPEAVSWLIDEERRARFNGEGQLHFESRYVMTFVWLPHPDQAESAARALFEPAEGEELGNWRQQLSGFIAETDRLSDLFAAFMPQICALGDAETLEYLHDKVSDKRHGVAVPETPVYLDAILADTALTGGLEPVLGNLHLRTLTILGFPNHSRPGILDALNHLDFAYRWVTRFIALDKSEAIPVLTRIRRQWFNKRKSLTAMLREVMYNQPAQLLDSDAENKVLDSDQALQALGGDHVAFGYLTTTITITDTDRKSANAKVRAAERIINGLGFTTIRESVNAVEAWLGSLAGHVYANVRQPLLHTLNLAHVMPLSQVWAGPSCNAHLSGPPLLYAETSGSTPFRLSTHVGDVGHMLVVGPTGAGKSVLLAMMAFQFRRYPGSRVYIFDKGLSARGATLMMGGTHHQLGGGKDNGNTVSFQPLRRIDEASECRWAADWICQLLAHEKIVVTPQVKEAVWSALTSLASAPAAERTLTGLSLLLQSNILKSALLPYTLEGPFGSLLDAAEDEFQLGDVECFETEALLATSSVVLPVLTYLFHRLEERFDGRPTLLILDEAWIFLDNDLFAARIREWLKVLRKKNVSVVFATQSLADVASSSISPAIIESCPQRIFLPNARAIEPQGRDIYARFGLNDRQIELISTASPKRQYYLQSSKGNRLFELGLGPIALACCATSDPASQKRIDAILEAHGTQDFAAHLLKASGLDWAATLLDQFSQSHTGADPSA
ncbi:MAG: conjugal transfer protein TrbE [Sphingorhabdus sp.]